MLLRYAAGVLLYRSSSKGDEVRARGDDAETDEDASDGSHDEGLEDAENAECAEEQIIMEEMTVRQTEEMADKAKGKSDKERKQTNFIPEHFKSKIKTLSQTLNTKVKVKRDIKGHGSVVIDFKDEAEFDRIMELFNHK